MEDNKQYEISVSCRSIKKKPKKPKKNNLPFVKKVRQKKAKENHNLPMSCPRLILNTYVSKSLVFV